MRNFVKKAGLGLALAATALTAAAPADAQRYRGRGYYGGYHGYHHRGGIGTGGAAILGGIVGLGVGAAIASSNRPYRGGYYDRGYAYRGGYGGGYGYPRAGYAYGYPPPPVQRCWTEQRFDPYYGYAIPVRVCG